MHLFLSKEDDQRHARPATKDNILAGVKAVLGKAGKDDVIIVAMFGRGAILADRVCYFTADSTVKDRAKSALASADLETEFHAFKGERLIAFLDVNYKGVDPGEEKLLEPRPADLARAFIPLNEEKDEQPAPQGRAIFLSNIGVAPAVDTEEHGLFAQVLLDGLNGKADREGYEPDGNITISELDSYIDSNLMSLARKYGKTNDEKLQSPIDLGAHDNHFVLAQNPAVMPKVKERLTKLPTLKLPAEEANEGEKLLAKMPKLNADQQLRKLYQQLADASITTEKFEAARAENFAGRKLNVDEAQAFAKKTMDGLLTIRQSYYKDLELANMTAWAVKGMYRRIDEEVPAKVKERLDNIKDKLDKIKETVDKENLTGDARRSRLDRLVSADSELRRPALTEFLTEVRQGLGRREDLEGYKDVDAAISMMMLNLDFPYTTYIDSESKK
ncbi:MAG: hypothetical protein ACJ8LM_13400, partial [Candidatus Udaeobacter sp.]